MSILEDVLTKAATKALGVDEDKAKIVAALLPVVIALLQHGGLQKIIDAMRKAGMDKQADSWIGDGENLGISGDQAKQILGDDKVKEIAEKAGVDDGKAADLIAKALPLAVDQLSPDGKEPSSGAVDEILGALKG